MNRSLHPGVKIGPYEIHSLVGEGGLGEVWKASDRASGGHAALRVLPNLPSADPHRFDRFERDVRVLTSLNHPNIATIYGVFEADGVRALAFEWIEGVVLAERIASAALPIDEALPIAAQIADALGAAHEHAVVHGDLKPSNIKLCPEGLVKVLDFGLAEVFEPDPVRQPAAAKPAASARLMGVVFGTAAYMSPEQVRGAPADTRSDVWAFGCVLYELLTGRSPFAGEDVDETMSLVMGATPEWTLVPPSTPAPIIDIAHRCLQTDMNARFEDMKDVSAAMKNANDDESARLIERALPTFRRWLHGRVPASFGLEQEDLVKEAATRVVESRRGRQPTHTGAFQILRQSVINRIRDELRKQGRQPSGGEDIDTNPELPYTVDQYREALQKLTERNRDLIVARVEHGQSYEEIAETFSLPGADAARMSVARAIKRLVEKLREEEQKN